MTVTYDIGTAVGKVRLRTGDKITGSPVFTDEEIEVFLANQSNNVNLASAELLEAWASSYAASADSEKIGDYAYTQKIVANMIKLAGTLRETEASTPVFEWSEPDYTSTVEED